MPLVEPMVATATVLLPHVPPPLVMLSETEAPAQTADGPLIEEGNGLTVIVFVT